MTKDELKQISALNLEIRLIQEELQNLPHTTDSVTGSDPEFPYTKHVIKIHGIDRDRGERLRKRLQRKLSDLQDKLQEMEDFLDEIPDSEMRVILRLKFRNGLSNYKIAIELDYDKSTITKKINNFFANK